MDRSRLMQALRAGASRTAAARYAGASLADLDKALAQDADLLAEVEGAEAECEVRCCGAIMRAATERPVEIRERTTKPDGTVVEKVRSGTEVDAKAAQWWLQVRRRSTFGR